MLEISLQMLVSQNTNGAFALRHVFGKIHEYCKYFSIISNICPPHCFLANKNPGKLKKYNFLFERKYKQHRKYSKTKQNESLEREMSQ